MNGGRIFVDWWAVIVILILVVVGNSAIAETSAGLLRVSPHTLRSAIPILRAKAIPGFNQHLGSTLPDWHRLPMMVATAPQSLIPPWSIHG